VAYQQIGVGGFLPELQLSAFEKRLLSRFRAGTVYNKWGIQKSIPRHGGKAIQFRRLESLLGASYAAAYQSGGAYASGPAILTEGTPGAAIDATWVTVTATINQFGNFIQVTDMAEGQSIDDVVPELTENFSEMMTEALDLFTRDILCAGTNVQYASTAGARGSLGSGMYLTLAELRKAKRTLTRLNAKPIKSEGGKYVVIAHPDALYDLEGDSNVVTAWQNAGTRGDANQIFDVAFSDLPFGFRLYVTSLARIFPSLGFSGADAYATMVLGEEAYGTVKLDAMPARIIRKEIGSAGANDPLDQVGTVGWKAAFAAVRLNENNLIRIEHVTSNKQ
jgi:N4-gp56 family major capsid protein